MRGLFRIFRKIAANSFDLSVQLPESLRSFSADNPHRDDVIFGQSAFKLEQLQPNDLMSADEKPVDMVFEEKVNRK